MAEDRENFKNHYAELSCPVCLSANDSQEHLLDCTENVLVDGDQVDYLDIFGEDTHRPVSKNLVRDLLEDRTWCLRGRVQNTIGFYFSKMNNFVLLSPISFLPDFLRTN